MTDVDDRAHAWALLHDARTEPAVLAQIAQRHPEFHEAIARHPNVYPQLQEWMSRSAASPSAGDGASRPPQAVTSIGQGEAAGGRGVGGWIRRHRIAAGAIAAGLVLLLGGTVGAFALLQPQHPAPLAVATATPTPTPTQTPRPTPTAIRTPTPTPTVTRPVRIELDGAEHAVNGVLVSTDGVAIMIFDPRLATGVTSTGEPNARATRPVAPSTTTEIVQSAYQFVGTGDELRVVFVYMVRTKADGLTPESFENRISVVDPFGDKILLDVPLAAAEPFDTTRGRQRISASDLVSGDEPVLYVAYQGPLGNVQTSRTDAISIETGHLLWSVPGLPLTSVESTVVMREAKTDRACALPVVRDALSGAVIAEYASGLLDRRGREVCARNVVTTTSRHYLVEHESGGYVLLEPATGAAVAEYPDAQIVRPDPVAPYVFVRESKAAGYTVTVWNLETAEPALILDADAASRLDFNLTTVFDGFLYFRNTDEAPIIDLRSGEKVSASAQVVPEKLLGDEWVLLRGSSSGQILVRYEAGSWYAR